MVFYFYEDAMDSVRKISVDSLVPNSFHLSSWVGNKTPKELKADTATAIALRFITDKNHNTLFPHANIISSSHFNSDGLLAVFTLLYPEKAEPMAKKLIEISEACDFSSFSSETGVQIHLLIEDMCRSEKSPLKKKRGSWFSSDQTESLYYKTLIPEIHDIIEKKDQYRYLWEDRFNQTTLSMERRIILFLVLSLVIIFSYELPRQASPDTPSVKGNSPFLEGCPKDRVFLMVFGGVKYISILFIKPDRLLRQKTDCSAVSFLRS